jgi:hypothetical protein
MSLKVLKTTITGIILSVSCMVNVANAGLIGVFGSNNNSNIVSFLNANGHTATNFGGSIDAGQLNGLDAVIGLRADGNGDLLNFVLGGGLYITEWRAAEWALDVANMLDADGVGIQRIGGNTPITQSALALSMGLGNGLPNPYSDGGRTEYDWTINNVGNDVDILATRPGDIPVIIGGQVGAGYAFINSLDWADSFPASNSTSGTWLLNALNADVRNVSQVPEPSTLAIFALGVMGLASRRFKKKS